MENNNARRGNLFQALVAVFFVVLLTVNWVQQFYRVRTFRNAFFCNLILIFFLLICMAWNKSGGFWPRKLFENKRQIIIFLCILLLGIIARTACLKDFPPDDGQLVEEAQAGEIAYTSMKNGELYPYFPLNDIEAEIGLRFLGRSMRALRAPFILIGITSVALYFIAARLFLKTYFAAIFSTCLFASCAFLAGSSRIAMETMAPIFTECLALAALFYACTKRDYASFAIAGFASGLLLLEYFSYKVVPLLALFLLFTYFMQKRRSPYCNEQKRGYSIANLFRYTPHLLLFVGLVLATALPVMLINPGEPLIFFTEGLFRHKMGLDPQYAVFSWQQILACNIGKIRQTASFIFAGGGGPNYDILPASMGIIEFFTGSFGLAALIYCACRAIRNPVKMFLVVSVALILILSAVLITNPSRYRLIPVIPFYLLAIGVLVDDIFDRYSRRKRAVMPILITLLIILVTLNLYNFFGVAKNNRQVQDSFYDLNIILAQTMASIQEKDPSAMIYLFSNLDYLDKHNAYYFLYDSGRVKVVTSSDQVGKGKGYVLAHDEFIRPARSLPGTGNCREWKTRFGRNKILLCELRKQE